MKIGYAHEQAVEELAGVGLPVARRGTAGHDHLHVRILQGRPAGLDVARALGEEAARVAGLGRGQVLLHEVEEHVVVEHGRRRRRGPRVLADHEARRAAEEGDRHDKAPANNNPEPARNVVLVVAVALASGVAVGGRGRRGGGWPAGGVGAGVGADDGAGVGASVCDTTTDVVATVVMASAWSTAAFASAASGDPAGAAAAIAATSVCTVATNVSEAASSDDSTPDESASTSSYPLASAVAAGTTIS